MQFKRLETYEDACAYISTIANNSFVAVDTETTGLDPIKDRLVDLVLCADSDALSVVFSASYIEALSKLNPTHTLIFHNFKFDLHFLKRAGYDLLAKHVIYDTMLMHHLYDENLEHSLDSIVKFKWNDPYKETFWNKYESYEAGSEEDKTTYTCKDTMYTLKVFNWLRERLHQNKIPKNLIDQVHALAFELFYTEYNGIKLDLDYLMTLGVELKTRIASLGPEMREAVAVETQIIEMDLWCIELDKRKTDKGKANVKKPVFSFESPKQLANLLYQQLELPKQFDPKTRRLTTNEGALKNLAGKHLVVDKLRENRKLQKMYTAFVEGILDTQRDGRIFPQFHINGTVTGRISSYKPNIQQMPARGDWAKIRGVFVPDEGHSIISADYGMLEIVVAAHYSQDKSLLKVVNEGASQHDITAEALGIDRNTAKTLNFAIQYGASVKKVKSILGCSENEAQGALDKYWETYKGLKVLIDTCKVKVDRGEPIVSIFGRRRHFEAGKRRVWDKAYRQAFNSLIQGTGADLTHGAYTLVANQLREKGWGRALFPVHDEIVISANNEYLTQCTNVLHNTMKAIGVLVHLSVPLTVQVSEPTARWEK